MGDDVLLPYDVRKPSIARAYDYLLGGKDNFAPDRELAARLLELDPGLTRGARENREFLIRAVDWVARQGINQFIDVGSGLPTMRNTHEAARAVLPEARVAYVDNDPVVVSHARALLTGEGVLALVRGRSGQPCPLTPPRRGNCSPGSAASRRARAGGCGHGQRD